MPQDADAPNEDNRKSARCKPEVKENSSQWLRTPQSIKRVFNKFPLRTYSPNGLPQRTAASSTQHTLYVFATEEGARKGQPSFNPGCLKWQTYLKSQGIDFNIRMSSNHASPTGVLPYLLPAALAFGRPSPVPYNRIERWTRETKSPQGPKRSDGAREDSWKDRDVSHQHQSEEPRQKDWEASEMRSAAYVSLLDNRIRNAYLYTLYLSPSNFDTIAAPLYIHPSTNNSIVRLALAHQLRAAAKAELLKQSSIVDVEALYRESEKAFSALSTLLGGKVFFSEEHIPNLFDASVFAYTNILLDEKIVWRDNRMCKDLERYPNLVKHRRRIKENYF